MKTQKIFSRILDGLILLVFILFFSSAGFQDKNTNGWYQQWFPNLNGSSITSITFLDSLTGFAVTNSTDSLQEYILRTTNGGDNWEVNYTSSNTWGFIRVISINSNTVFAVRSYTEILKTTNRGNNWQIIPLNIFCYDISILNNDTMLVANSSSFDGGIYRSTNGGYNWQLIWTNGSGGNPFSLYMYDKNMGFHNSGTYVRKTTNGGVNWMDFSGGGGYTGIEFLDSLTGWKTAAGIKKTTNGGLNWFSQQLPNLPHSYLKTNLKIINKDIVWMVGDQSFYAPIYKTTNGGENWGYQKADTSVHITVYNLIDFTNQWNGWIYSLYYTSGIHTKTGGNDTTFLTGINNIVTVSPKDYTLYQNYPNPFNSSTVVRYQLLVDSKVSIKLYDVQGREIQTLVEKRLNTGVYEYIFNGNNLSSGIYFYTLYVNDLLIETKRMTLLK